MIFDMRGRWLAGWLCEIELVVGGTIHVWRSTDGTEYFCHGLTFGGKDAPGGCISPFTGTPVETILAVNYDALEERFARPDDIVVWRGIPPETAPHSAILTDLVLTVGGMRLDYSSRLQTKNGMMPETNTTLEILLKPYGESYTTYRRK
jgi:hypothetical protein